MSVPSHKVPDKEDASTATHPAIRLKWLESYGKLGEVANLSFTPILSKLIGFKDTYLFFWITVWSTWKAQLKAARLISKSVNFPTSQVRGQRGRQASLSPVLFKRKSDSPFHPHLAVVGFL